VDESVEPAEPANGVPDSTLGSETVLLVEDEEMTRSLTGEVKD